MHRRTPDGVRASLIRISSLKKMEVLSSIPTRFAYAPEGRTPIYAIAGAVAGFSANALDLGIERGMIGHAISDLASTTSVEVDIDSVTSFSGELVFVS